MSLSPAQKQLLRLIASELVESYRKPEKPASQDQKQTHLKRVANQR